MASSADNFSRSNCWIYNDLQLVYKFLSISNVWLNTITIFQIEYQHIQNDNIFKKEICILLQIRAFLLRQRVHQTCVLDVRDLKA